MFDADKPIQQSNEDCLNRSIFAKNIARAMLDHTNPESLVVGLYGDWGSGKTSLINLTREELQIASNNSFEDEQPIVLNFSAWSYSGQTQLTYAFFRRLSSELHRAPELKHSARIIFLLELYVSFFTNQPVPFILQPKHSFFKKLFRKKVNWVGWESGMDLTLVKQELNVLLSELKRKIIIFIDNISRLEDEEIKQLFQIVKSMGNFSNTIYVLSLDESQIIHALDRIHQSHDGYDYLEKVIQLPFRVPHIADQELETLFLNKLQPLVNQLPEDSWDKDYWVDIYYAAIRHSFTQCREITHFINTAGFGLMRLKEIVNPVDFLAITWISFFAPEIYEGIRDNKDLFTDLMDNVYKLTPEKIAEDKLRCDEIFKREDHFPIDKIKPLLIRLFPRLRHFYVPDIPFYHSESIARKNKRICCPDVFDIYFRLSIPEGIMPHAQIKAVLDLLHDEEGFSLAILGLNQDEKILKFLDVLDGADKNLIPTQYIKHVVQALLDGGDLFPEGQNTPLQFNTALKIHRILHQLLKRFEISLHRFDILRDAIMLSTNSIYISIHEIKMLEEEHIELSDTFLPIEERDVTPDQLQKLKSAAVEKIENWAKTKRLAEHPKLIPILFAWKDWEKTNACQQYVHQLIREDRGLIDFLTVALKIPIDETILKLEKSAAWEMYLENIAAFVSLSEIEPLARAIFENQSFEQLREREQLAILIFLDLVKSHNNKIIPNTTA